jgi:hypothetical protein
MIKALFFVYILVYFCVSFKLVRFGGAGIYFWWQAGAATFLQQNYDLSNVQYFGASAGAITASLLLSNASFYNGAKIAISQVEEQDLWNKKSGLRGVWGPMVRSFLEELINENQLKTTDYERIYISVTPAFIFKGTRLITNFENKVNLIDAVMASVHIPLFMNGRFWSKYQNHRYIDGSFWSFISKQPEPLPSQFTSFSNDILDIKYQHDEAFLTSLKNRQNIVELIKPDGLYQMMDYGYEYMKQQSRVGKLNSLPKLRYSSSVISSSSDSSRS